MSKHPTRQELIKALKSNSGQLADHLKSCEECQLLFGVLRKTLADNAPLLISAPEAWIKEAIQITGTRKLTQAVRKLVASLTFDSWVARPAVALRSTGTDARRLSFDAGEAKIDFQCSGRKGDWQLTASLRGANIETDQFKLKAGRKVIRPDENELFTWSTKSLPKSLQFSSESLLIEVDKIDWPN